MSEQCPICESDLNELTVEYEYTDRFGKSWVVPEYVFSECVECKNEWVSARQSKQNDENKTEVRTKYCPHCASDRVSKVTESDGTHYHECNDCQEAWEHHD